MQLLSLLLVPLLLSLSSVAHPAYPWKRDTFANQVVAQHNAARAKYGAQPITWNSALYNNTLAYAKKCVFEHRNIFCCRLLVLMFEPKKAAGSWDTYGIVDAVNDWMSEAPDYDYNHPGFSEGTGHFTQVVWKSTTQVACAVASCPAGTIFSDYASQYVICRYTPPGNYDGEFAHYNGSSLFSSGVRVGVWGDSNRTISCKSHTYVAKKQRYHQQNVQLHFGNLDFDVSNFEQLFQLYRELSLQEYNFDFDFYSLNYFMNVFHFVV
ncbi:uncharacterized protein LACBIDRAFT_334862 [Laccaria bicolor S238N-H82]|uniref:Predicted protein n=1 Tax=Laccaria bicolor (strain S238N-H82 / ATCC MYA-4686) TaxID=486041 RepID=B0E0L0_LACBS|nr:uncharacterized protein LACBIDRAFT_334862 [Laccaria bicolor S238N-H82]EDQ99604.1 predicted protein [Laccaria bicolor S238N-H82]|eukprot:XP_001889715.1 predicted protein [Laccaria bicolor S238N-H82]